MNTATNVQQQPAALTFILLRLLTDGEFHSGEMLARQLGISRASVSNALRGVESYGLSLYSVRGRGYCLSNPPQWLDARRIAEQMGAHGNNFKIEILDSAASSNTELMLRIKSDAEDALSGSVLAVEWQSGGRGRLGRNWHSGLGNALTFSLLWRFDCGLSALSGLSLATGVALIRALRVLGLADAQLKWPNDVLFGEAKLAGILIETLGDMSGPSAVVIGIGVNLSLQPQQLQQIEQAATALAEMTEAVPERNHLFALILLQLDEVLHEFAAHGFTALRSEWQSYHAMQNQAVQLTLPDGSHIDGIVRGVADDGALELETMQQIRKFNVGEVSLRSAPHVAA